MDVRQLQYLVAVVDAGSILAGSRAVNVSQPALSKRLKELETSVGARLLDRSSRGVRLTPAGQDLVVHARAVIEALNGAQQCAAGLKQRGRLVELGATPTPAVTLIPSMMELCDRAAPPIELAIRMGSPREILTFLMQGDIDGLLTFAPPGRSQAFDITPLYMEDLVLVGRPDVVDSAAGDIPFSALDGVPVLLSPAIHMTHQMVMRTAAQAGMTLDVRGRIEPTAIKRSIMLRDGVCSIVIGSVYREEVERGILAERRIVEPNLPLTLHLALARRLDPALREDIAAAARQATDAIIRSKAQAWRPAA